MGVDNLLGLRYHGIFYIGGISQLQQQCVSKGSVGLCIPRIRRVITIWDELFFKLRVSFYVMVISKKVLLEFIQHIETRLDVIVEVLEV